jgi:serine/threonine protein kinase
MTIPCPNCGRLNRPGSRFCASCQAGLTVSHPAGDPGAPQASQPEGGAQAAPPPRPTLRSGQIVGGGAFRIVRPLGKGGMGATFLVAQTRAFDRLAVLKEVIDYFDPGDGEARQKALELFEAEARILAELKHPGIPDLYAFFTEQGHNYLVMEYIDGPDLSRGLTHEDRDSAEIVAGGPLPAEQALQYTIQICEVLEYLAGRQPPVVHNDIKPANILLDGHSGRAVLVDFGTAKARYLRAAGQSDRRKEVIYGTVGYAAPELYQGRSEPRSDVYSLAATAYHLLTDDDPRDHPGQYPLIETLPPALAEILRGALEPDINRRLAADQYRQQVERYLAGQTVAVHALTFPDGDSANGRDELLAQAMKHWGYTAGLLQDGTLARWLRGTLRDASGTQAAADAVKQWPGNPDAALDAFLRQLNPQAMPPGKLELHTTTIRLPSLSPHPPVQARIEIANRGQGYLRGKAFTTMPWLKVVDTFGCPPGESCTVPVEIDPSRLTPGQRYQAGVTLEPAGGPPEVVPVEIGLAGTEMAPASSQAVVPAVAAKPGSVELSAFRGDSSPTRRRVVVTNTGSVRARCRVLGAPPWLVVTPEQFELAPRARQTLELVARADKVPGRRQEVTVAIAVEGGQGCEVQVTVQTRSLLFG